MMDTCTKRIIDPMGKEEDADWWFNTKVVGGLYLGILVGFPLLVGLVHLLITIGSR